MVETPSRSDCTTLFSSLSFRYSFICLCTVRSGVGRSSHSASHPWSKVYATSTAPRASASGLTRTTHRRRDGRRQRFGLFRPAISAALAVGNRSQLHHARVGTAGIATRRSGRSWAPSRCKGSAMPQESQRNGSARAFSRKSGSGDAPHSSSGMCWGTTPLYDATLSGDLMRSNRHRRRALILMFRWHGSATARRVRPTCSIVVRRKDCPDLSRALGADARRHLCRGWRLVTGGQRSDWRMFSTLRGVGCRRCHELRFQYCLVYAADLESARPGANRVQVRVNLDPTPPRASAAKGYVRALDVVSGLQARLWSAYLKVRLRPLVSNPTRAQTPSFRAIRR